ncbi:hybrid sensor histidine kinase/response regulator [Sulfitobacter guttiformis]|uniref:histidine kinase n=1 Tax=Sulfitobacter guttiformis TaxID=74349 RepID=A0A420DIZ8_9RHOB|nr:ATP-binding protein [Sulfitobacter guttiformis]KIN72021.1 Two-component hybrid sensor and regulator [Sulfitobacter guttiformis KCTC 32187]RKE94188.1 signal transduction histidine kinase [Sulfitobacter guttiformis]
MATGLQATSEKRTYNRWVANETMEDFALRFTARRARRWSYARVANTAIGSISFLALEAIGAAITITYGFDIAIAAIMFVGALLFLTGFPICYYAARYGVDIDLLTRGAGFGYIGSTITSLIYASFTFIFFALEAAILALALNFLFGLPIFLGYIVSSLVVIPLVINGFSKISTFQTWTQPFWVVLHILPFALLAFVGYDLDGWKELEGTEEAKGTSALLMFGAASGVIFSLVAQIGEQVDFLRFLPEPKTKSDRRKWLTALIIAGPGWSVIGVLKMLAGSYLVTLAIRESVPIEEAADPTLMYFTAFDQVFGSPAVVLALTGLFVVLSQLKINVTNAYAGSIAWSNFFSRLTHSHPGRVVWLVFNVAIAVLLMELGVFEGLETVLGFYAHVAVAWIGALVADLVVNKPLGLSPKGIEFRRGHLYDINPVGIGAMGLSCVLSLLAIAGIFGPTAEAFSTLVALGSAFALAPLIAFLTGGKYYLARPAVTLPPEGLQTCSICDFRFDAEDMTHCPFHAGTICSLCCTLDSNCQDSCKPHARFETNFRNMLGRIFRPEVTKILLSRPSRFAVFTGLIGGCLGVVLLLIKSLEGTEKFSAVLTVIFGAALIIIGVCVWMFLLVSESHGKARAESSLQTDRLLREIRAHERTDLALQDAKDKAEAANLAKTRYMAGLSHELRTPLNAIYGFAQILEKDPRMPAHRAESVTTIRRSSEHLAGLIEGLLDIARIEAGRLEIMRDRINLRMFLKQIASIFEQEARDKGVTFEIETYGSFPEWVGFDEKRLRQILINLLSNALRYTHAGQVRLKVIYRNEVAQIEVSDTGVGIAPEFLPRIWRPFERGSYTETRGSGLGLTITKLLVEILGGDISVESVLGQGSTFKVRLMLPSISNETMKRRGLTKEARSLPVVGYHGARKTILAVDDDLNHLSLVRSVFEPLSFIVVTAPNAEVALEILSDITPDLFVLDIDLPGQDGWTLASHLRSGALVGIPIIMISGHAMDAEKPTRQISLYDAFVSKPYNLDDLVMRVAELLKLDLTFETPVGPAAETSQKLQAFHPSELIPLVRSGQVNEIRKRLLELEKTQVCPPELLLALKECFASFDLKTMALLLEGAPNG